MMTFEEVEPDAILKAYPSCFHGKARYFRVIKNNKPLCLYGVINHAPEAGEAFLMFQSFQRKVLTRDFFVSLFKHVSSLGYGQVYTWTRWDKLIKLFGHFEKLGIERIGCPPWDQTPGRTWFIKRM